MTTTPAVTAVLQDLVVDGTLTAAQAGRVAERLTAAPDAPTAPDAPDAPALDAPAEHLRTGSRLAEIAGYAGGSLLLGAVGLFLGNGWQDLSETARVMIMAGTTVLLIVAGAVIALAYGSVRALGRVHDSARRRLVSVLWTFAAGSAASAAALSMNNHQHAHELVAASGAGLVVVGLGYALVPSAVAQFGAWVASIGLVCGLITEFGDQRSTTPYAVALFTLGAIWAGLAVTNTLREKQAALALGAGLALFAGQLQVGDGSSGLGYALTAAVAVAGFAGFVLTRSWPVLGAGVLAMTLVVPEALHDWTNGSVSSAGSLLIAGLTLLGASAIGLRLRREVG
jgi:hypothetical protein